MDAEHITSFLHPDGRDANAIPFTEDQSVRFKQRKQLAHRSPADAETTAKLPFARQTQVSGMPPVMEVPEKITPETVVDDSRSHKPAGIRFVTVVAAPFVRMVSPGSRRTAWIPSGITMLASANSPFRSSSPRIIPCGVDTVIRA